MEDAVGFRMKLRDNELELTGSREFVEQMLGEYLPRIERSTPGALAGTPAARSDETGEAGDQPREFGEYFAEYRDGITDLDRMLIAANFVQQQAPDQSFSTGEANQLLQAQGVKVANPSMCNRRNLQAKRVFALGSRKFRVSKQGIDYLATLKQS